MALHPDLEAEQAYIDHAYECPEAARARASRLQGMVEVGRGGTEQARFERDAIWENVLNRLSQLQLGDASLCFGRIDQRPEEGDGSYYIGRLSVADEHQEPVVVDWRAPVAEPFYRATGRQTLGLARRRHFATRGRQLLDIEDELFDEYATNLAAGRAGGEDANGSRPISGHGALIAALETARSGRLGDIVATIQGEQDEIIRAPLPGLLVVQGGPGTGKTVVALHRAAYLLYTHRFPLADQGVLVVGPNRLFLAYIEQVLPSLGEAGVELAVLADLVDGVRVRGRDRPDPARIKGDLRMADLVRRAVRDRQRPLRDTLRVPYGLTHLTVTPDQSAGIVASARRRSRTHNAGRRHVGAGLYEALAASGEELEADQVRDRVRRRPEVREALERMWPVLSPAALLRDLYGSPALLRLAARGALDDGERAVLHRPREVDTDRILWTEDDVPLLDEARARLGPLPRSRARREADAERGVRGADEQRTYGHIVVDEAQDLSPMQLRTLARRSLNGSMTVVGDIAQATGAWAHLDWDEVLEHLPDRREPRRVELTVGYRIPSATMALASRVLAVAAPELTPPTSVREGGDPPRIVAVADAGDLGAGVAAAVATEAEAVGNGNLAVICRAQAVGPTSEALASAGVAHGRATEAGLDHQVTVVPVGLVKGLELDAVVVVEPSDIVAGEPQGHRALYVALTRATKRLAIVHHRPLPAVLEG